MIQPALESKRIERVPRLAEIATGSAHRSDADREKTRPAACITQRAFYFNGCATPTAPKRRSARYSLRRNDGPARCRHE
ncbi:hypothetical protein XpopCFBP1817_14555 [Xanthomonas populi]|uniref:Uncharacterized protein n=1 Tax=Xanthomonas populi TaxID=53414 RepID=A0A2S7ELW5_9XANT|nr:hypothetical protein XpopCFBP1817_14555 [Xanthomonas populi]